MKKYIKFLLVIIMIFILTGCTENKIKTITYIFGDNINVETKKIDKGSKLQLIDDIYEGFDILGFYLDDSYNQELNNAYIVKNDITIYVKIKLEKYNVVFYNEDEIYDQYMLEYKELVHLPTEPTKDNYHFVGWSINKNEIVLYDFNNYIESDITLYAVWKMAEYQITYEVGYKYYNTKDELYKSYFTDFYNFLIEFTDVDLAQFEIETLNDFLDFCLDWNANGQNSFYGVGDAFSKYYVTIDIGGTLDEQPETTFVGYCYHNDMYLDFIPFLMEFFAYWRTDEGYTGGKDDPNNLGNDFFASAWASLVDTCKFFYFTGDNLNDTYAWFTSERVKYALDNVPSVVNYELNEYGKYPEVILLKDITRNGYQFLGWFDSLEEDANKIRYADETITIYAKWKKEGE